MKTIRWISLFLAMGITSCRPSFEEKVELSVQYQLSLYPESHLQDLYKNFFQDRFGPGHLISDTAMVGRYLRSELDSYTQTGPRWVEPVGWEGNFYRISVDVIKKNLVSPALYLEAFVESANAMPETSPEEWQTEWRKIIAVLEQMDLNLPDYEMEKVALGQLVDSGIYAVHHSRAFEDAYHPHYRIIRKDIYEDKLKRLVGE